MEKLKQLQQLIHEVGFLNRYQEFFGDNDFNFLKRVYNTSFDIYYQRLKAIGFFNAQRVLDAGCGFGQWGLVLSTLNKDVVAIDKAADRLFFFRDLVEFAKIKNITIKNSSISNTPFAESEFDAIFCYGTIFIDDPIKSLKEFYRLLKPGGKLYFNANGLGYQLNLWINTPNKTSDYNPKQNVIKAFQNTLNYFSGFPKNDGQIILDKSYVLDELKKIGFSEIIYGSEGEINLQKDIYKVEPFFKGEYFGFEGVFEFLCIK